MDYASVVNELSERILASVKSMVRTVPCDHTYKGRVTKIIASDKYAVVIQGKTYTATSAYVCNADEFVWCTAPNNDFNNLFVVAKVTGDLTCFAPNETWRYTGALSCTGVLTTDRSEINFTIPLPKNMSKIKGLVVAKLKTNIRMNGVYLFNGTYVTGGYDLLANGIQYSIAAMGDNFVTLTLYQDAHALIYQTNNNYPVVVQVNDIELRFY